MIFRATAITLLAAASLQTQAQLHPRERFAITGEQVAAKVIATFAQKGVVLSAQQVSLPAAITATEEAPALQVHAVEQLGRVRGQQGDSLTTAVKLACASTRICMPFYAVVAWSSDEGVPAGSASVANAQGSNTFKSSPVIRSGSPVTLLMQSGTTHIQMGVVSSENGAVGQQIKVRTTDRKQTYLAEVVDAHTVKGTY